MGAKAKMSEICYSMYSCMTLYCSLGLDHDYIESAFLLLLWKYIIIPVFSSVTKYINDTLVLVSAQN